MNGNNDGNNKPTKDSDNYEEDVYVEINKVSIALAALKATLICMTDVIKTIMSIAVGIIAFYLLYKLIGKTLFVWFVVTPIIVAFFYYFFLCYDEIQAQLFDDDIYDDGNGDDGDADIEADDFEERFNEHFNNKFGE